jgi:hypothetical protein
MIAVDSGFLVDRREVIGLRSDELVDAVIRPFMSEYALRWPSSTWMAALTAEQRAAFTVSVVADEVDNGGLTQLFANVPVEIVEQAVSSLRGLDLIPQAQGLRRAIDAFRSHGATEDAPWGSGSSRSSSLLEPEEARRVELSVGSPKVRDEIADLVTRNPAHFFREEEDTVGTVDSELRAASKLMSRNSPGDLERAQLILDRLLSSSGPQFTEPPNDGRASVRERARSLRDQLDAQRT